MRRLRALLRGRRGQIVIPALFVVPSLVLFIYLIYETAKLSKDKIRHQFALDTAAFVEMGNYSDFLNRTAYVNGAFPARVGYEAFNGLTIQCVPEFCKGGGDLNFYKYLTQNGLLPFSPNCKDPSSCQELNNPSQNNWGFTYSTNGPAQKMNGTTGLASQDPQVPSTIWLVDMGSANAYYMLQNTVWGANGLASLYNLIFSLLGTVENSQISVFQRFQSSHYFFSRAYTMNLPGERGTAMSQFPSLSPSPKSVSAIGAYTRDMQSNTLQTYKGVSQLASPIVLVTTVGGLDSTQSLPRRDIVQYWDPGPPSQNRFAVDLRGVVGRPYVHVQVEVSGGQVWPSATPRYQVRIYP